jgi:hypothetical protein
MDDFTTPIFARALGLLLRNHEGIVVDIPEDIDFDFGDTFDDPDCKKVIVHVRDCDIIITEWNKDAEPQMPEGIKTWMHPEDDEGWWPEEGLN